ncbi:hypothetical protein AA313_de0205484 [Arthrobotrys entomopaga]|nr:hypothetical protein AA313_de0205484 [Arthrobotrys entomopaga]
MQFHLDPAVDWSEVTHANIISADRNRHNGCNNERLDLKRRLRWKALIRCGLLTGWKLTDRNAMVQDFTVVKDQDDDDDDDDDEMMEAVDEKEIQKIVGNNKQNDEDGGCVVERIEVIDGVEVEAGDLIGYELRRTSGAGVLGTIHEEPSDEEDEAESAANRSFQIASSTDTSTTSEASTELNDDVEMGSVNIGYIPEEASAQLGPGEGSEKKEDHSATVVRESDAQVKTDGAATLDWIPCESARDTNEPKKRNDIRTALALTLSKRLSKNDNPAKPNEEQSPLQNPSGVDSDISARLGEQQNIATIKHTIATVKHTNAQQTSLMLTEVPKEAALIQGENVQTVPTFSLSDEEIYEENASDASTEKSPDEKPISND